MLGKLMKYEWRGYRFPLVVILIVLLSTTLLVGGMVFTINPNFENVFSGFTTMTMIVLFLVYYIGLIGCSLGIVIIIAIRFYKTCYTDQGYLTHTLPVEPVTLLNAKIFTAIFACLATLIAILASVLVLAQVILWHLGNVYPDDMEYFWSAIGNLNIAGSFKEDMGISLGAFILIIAVGLLISVISNIITIYGCLSLGQLYAKHRIVGAIAAYFIIQVIEQILGTFAAIPMYSAMSNATYDTKVFEIISPTMISSIIIVVIIAVAMYFANLYMMTKKLNLE
jgi:hypothetical protein